MGCLTEFGQKIPEMNVSERVDTRSTQVCCVTPSELRERSSWRSPQIRKFSEIWWEIQQKPRKYVHSQGNHQIWLNFCASFWIHLTNPDSLDIFWSNSYEHLMYRKIIKIFEFYFFNVKKIWFLMRTFIFYLCDKVRTHNHKGISIFLYKT